MPCDGAPARLTAILRPSHTVCNALPTAGVTSTYLEGPVADPGSPDTELVAPVRMKETNLGDLVCDALIDFVQVSMK